MYCMLRTLGCGLNDMLLLRLITDLCLLFVIIIIVVIVIIITYCYLFLFTTDSSGKLLETYKCNAMN